MTVGSSRGFELGQYNQKYKYNYRMSGHAINHGYLMWCEENITDGYGWGFSREKPYITEPSKGDRAHVSFKTKRDLGKFTWYMLSQDEN